MNINDVKKHIKKSYLGNLDINNILCYHFNQTLTEISNKQNISYFQFLSITRLIKKLNKQTPLQQACKRAYFYGREFYVNKNVLIPRFDTEILVHEALKMIDNQKRVLDLCCGSGAIGLTLAAEKNADITLSDISSKALKIAKKNAKLHQLNVNIKKSNLFDKLDSQFDLIVSNPPYIKTEDIALLDAEVKNYEPHLALNGGEDGLDFYKRIIEESPKYLNDKGTLMFEVGQNQAKSVMKIMENNFENIRSVCDLTGIERVVIGEIKK